MIRCEHIYKSFDGKPVLEDISATFLPGEINMIIGRSGSGKTVLIKSIAGLFPVDEGEIYYGDTLFTSLDFRQKKAIRRDVGMIFQGGALLDSSTVEENIRFPLDMFASKSVSMALAVSAVWSSAAAWHNHPEIEIVGINDLCCPRLSGLYAEV